MHIKLTDESMLPALETAKAEIAKHMTARLSALQEHHETAIAARISHAKDALVFEQVAQTIKK